MYEDFIERMYKVFSDAEKPTLDEMTPHRCCECDEVRDQLHAYDKRDVPDKWSLTKNISKGAWVYGCNKNQGAR